LEIEIVFPSGISSSLKNIFINGNAIYKNTIKKMLLLFFIIRKKFVLFAIKSQGELKMQLLLNFGQSGFSHNLKKSLEVYF